MPRLQVLNGKRQGAIFDIAPNSEHVIGHRATAAIPIDDPWVSWDHARLFFDGSGTCAIEDLGSTNGTYVNCVRVKRERLTHEDIIFLGKTHVIFLAPVEEGQQTAYASASSGSHLLGGAPFVDSEHGAFHSAGATPLVASRPQDPFASTAPNRASGSGSRAGFASGQDPFAESGIDPFATGPEPSFPSALGGGFEDFSGSGGTSKLTRGELDDLGHDPFGIDDPFGGPLGPPADDPFGVEAPVADPFGAQADPLESSVLRANVGGGYHVNDLSDPAGQAPPPLENSEESTIPLSRRGKKANPFAETRGDDEVSPLHDSQRQRPSRSLSLSSLQNDGEPELPGPTHREITDLLGDDNALSALDDPAFGLSSDGLDKLDASEMRTRMLDTARVSELIAEDDLLASNEPLTLDHAGDWGEASPPPPPPPPPPPQPHPVGVESTHADLLAKSAAADMGRAAFERARLEDEVRRLRAALQAAQQQNPQAVQAAAQALRDEQLGMAAQRVAELERDLAVARAELGERERELNFVTEDMIEKEDLIDRLQARLEEFGVDPDEFD